MSDRSDQRHRKTISVLFLIAGIALAAMVAILSIDVQDRESKGPDSGPPPLTTMITPPGAQKSVPRVLDSQESGVGENKPFQGSEFLPPDLQAQVSKSPPPLPDDLKAQLEESPPPLPQDIKDALSKEPRLVTEDEVNGTPQD